MGRASKQTYLGRVVYPAQFHEGVNNGKPFLTFTLFVDRLAVNKTKERVTGKINCSYSISGDQDPVAHILSRIFTQESPQGLAGQTYKFVDVFVEGSEKLTELCGESGKPTGAYYKGLDYCTVQVVSPELVQLFKAHMGQDSQGLVSGDSSEESVSAQPARQANKVQQPTIAPLPKAAPPPPSPQEEASPTYKVGDILAHNGVEYQFNGGDPGKMQNWTPVRIVTLQQAAPAPVPAPQRAAVKTKVTPQSMPSAFSEALSDSGIKGSLPFEDETDIPV